MKIKNLDSRVDSKYLIEDRIFTLSEITESNGDIRWALVERGEVLLYGPGPCTATIEELLSSITEEGFGTKEYEVTVRRETYSLHTFKVNAKSEDEFLHEYALRLAREFNWSKKDEEYSDYEVKDIQIK